jgi:hypothetical protein
MLGHHSQGKNKNYLKVARDKLPPKANPNLGSQLTLSEDVPNGLSVGRIGKNH